MSGEERLNDIWERFCVGVLLDLCEEDMAQDHAKQQLAPIRSGDIDPYTGLPYEDSYIGGWNEMARDLATVPS